MLTNEDKRDLLLAYDAITEVQDTLQDLMFNYHMDPAEERPAGRMSRIWSIIYRHSRFYTEDDSKVGDMFEALDEPLENRDMDIDERIRQVFGE